MSEDRNSGASTTLLSFLLGGLAGAAAAILFAPRSGKETRDLLEEKLRTGADRGRDLRDKVVTKSREILDEASEYVEKQRDGLEKRKDRFTAAVEAGRQAYREEKDKM